MPCNSVSLHYTSSSEASIIFALKSSQWSCSKVMVSLKKNPQMYGQIGVEYRKAVSHQYTSDGRTYREIDRKAKHFSDAGLIRLMRM